MKAVLDTSFFIATESGRPLGEMDGITETEISVMTLAELTVGVLVAATAVVERIPVVTRDRDYDAIPGVEVIRV